MKDWISIFKTGAHTDSAGNTADYDETYLDGIVSKYNPAKHTAPVVIGHPKVNAPAWAWVDSVKREGQILYYRERDPQPEFNEMRKRGLFKKRSISLYSDGSLRHVGWLGAQPPALKGLEDVVFNEGDQITIEFNEEGGSMLDEIKKMFSDMRAEIKSIVAGAKKGENIDMTEQEIQQKINEGITAALKKKDAEFTEAIKTKETEFSERESALKKKEDALNAKATEGKKKAVADFCEGLKKEGKLLPVMDKLGMGVTEFMNQISGIETTIEFGEGADKKKQTLIEFMQAFLTALPKQIEFGEVAKRETDPGAGSDTEKRDKAINNFMEKNKDVTYKEAVLTVSKEHPELFQREED
ncbi:MAG: hypothetical protein HZA14_12445 [Nitrospirae bacterium]|nr:hypothetical protein [Nitrospirota bacterium]